ncbi:helix-turn-helix domain-containing protein [Actinocorallia sp. A-T 12471]|uniref:TetR/AcrR family transcriptional regulator n=1 Tax=Actinocorallia sp. A-T 12471 TaxID=3089813 RepID=UPI0029CFD6DA|nr:helix-turn-helix domain-containing protein [Actinocorallia sp. A-T 12471]MDX6739515.1 helix-turn-helix domain-containing protein [Actinocorallia sp. A-T 12471]
MSRLSRAESQARTRDLLLRTARELFLRDGYHATSLEKVADAAGFSKGAVYSNFATKDALCEEVIAQVRGEHVAAIAALFLAEGSLTEHLRAFDAWAETTVGDPGWTLLEAEFAIHAARSAPEARARVAEGGRQAARALADLLRAELRRTPRDLPLPVDELAETILGLGIGLGLRRAVDPELSPRPLGDLIRLLLAR